NPPYPAPTLHAPRCRGGDVSSSNLCFPDVGEGTDTDTHSQMQG
ncbi:unnamed protein product, partial [Ectocarpus sp. 13 AM-2016]